MKNRFLNIIIIILILIFAMVLFIGYKNNYLNNRIEEQVSENIKDNKTDFIKKISIKINGGKIKKEDLFPIIKDLDNEKLLEIHNAFNDQNIIVEFNLEDVYINIPMIKTLEIYEENKSIETIHYIIYASEHKLIEKSDYKKKVKIEMFDTIIECPLELFVLSTFYRNDLRTFDIATFIYRLHENKISIPNEVYNYKTSIIYGYNDKGDKLVIDVSIQDLLLFLDNQNESIKYNPNFIKYAYDKKYFDKEANDKIYIQIYNYYINSRLVSNKKGMAQTFKEYYDNLNFYTDDVETRNTYFVHCSIKDLVNFYNNNELDIINLLDNAEFMENNRVFINVLQKKKALQNVNIVGMSRYKEFFDKYGSVDQHGLMNLYNETKLGINNDELEELVTFFGNKYGLTKEEILIICKNMDLVGVCTLADMGNIIFELYIDDQDKFEKDFGYKMFKNGKINGNQLLLDIYIYLNSGSLEEDKIIINTNGKCSLNKKYIKNNDELDVSGQAISEISNETNNREYDKFRQFLKENKFSLFNINNIVIQEKHFNSKTDYDYFGNISKEGYNILNEAIKKNLPISSIILPGSTLYEFDKDIISSIQQLHAVTIIGMAEQGVIVRSWNKSYYVPFQYIASFTILDIAK